MTKQAMTLLFVAMTVSGTVSALPNQGQFIECESFHDLGGWIVDPHAMNRIGSSYVMAHGYGKPVRDAVTTVTFPAAGCYAVWARTRNWNAVWTKGAAGRFQLVINGTTLPTELGTRGKDWEWQLAGHVDLPAKEAVEIRLHDLTGFNGRCDALWFSLDDRDLPPNDADALRAWKKARGELHFRDAIRTWDLVVIGGGLSGICVAQTAARYGVKTLLLQDRPVLGGCNSSEVRVSAGGAINMGPYPALGNVLREIMPIHGDYIPLPAQFYEDDRKAMAFQTHDLPILAVVNQSVFGVEKDEGGRITAVLYRDTRTGEEIRVKAPLFCDATGDGTIARLAGCAAMYGREGRDTYNEPNAPMKADRQVMGHSIQWTTRIEPADVPFPDIDWALPITEETVNYATGGSWEQEAGQYRDMAEETEIIRDYGLLAIFSNWCFLKNSSRRKAQWRNRTFEWISPIGGKRESYRVVGDYILTQNDLEGQKKFDDGTAVITWDIDLHFPDPQNEKAFGEPFRSCALHRGYGDPVAVPYRCLYARDCPNLFLAGRDISCSHVAFAAVRVQKTLGMLGEVVGMAAGICKEKACTPRAVYTDHLSLLKERMTKGAPPRSQYCAFWGGLHESYHFKELGFIRIGPDPTTNLSERVKSAIDAIGMEHRHKHPELSR